MQDLTGKQLFDMVAERVHVLLEVSDVRGDLNDVTQELAEFLFENQIMCIASERLGSEEADKPFVILSRHGGSDLEAQSFKLSNVRFNIGNLLRAVGSGTLSVVGAATNPILCVTAILLLIGDLYASTKIEISAHHAYVLKSIWDLRFAEPSRPNIHKMANALLAEDGLEPLDLTRLQACVNVLEEYGCVKADASSSYFVAEAVHARPSAK